MKNRHKAALLTLPAVLLCTLSGCGALFPVPPSTECAALSLDLESPDEVRLTWDPAIVEVNGAEVSVTENGPSRTVTVTVQLGPQG